MSERVNKRVNECAKTVRHRSHFVAAEAREKKEGEKKEAERRKTSARRTNNKNEDEQDEWG